MSAPAGRGRTKRTMGEGNRGPISRTVRPRTRRRRIHGVGTVAAALAALLLAACGEGEPRRVAEGEPNTAAEPEGTSDRGDGPSAMTGMSGSSDTGGDPAMRGMPGMPGMRGGAMEGAAGPTVRLEPGQAERIGLLWGEAAREPLVRTIRTSAVVAYPESGMRWVSPKVSGWVERLHVTFEGAPVRRGQPLLELYSPELVTAQEELLLSRDLEEDLAAGGIRRAGDSLFAVARRRLAYWDISEAQVRRLLETGEVRKTLTLEAPATGIVMRKQVFEGQGVKAGENLMMIAPTDPVWIEAAVYEQDLPFVREGLSADVVVEGLPGEPLRGRVAYVYPELRESSRTVVARIEVPNPDGQLRPGMYATVRIENRTDPVLSVPASALLHTGTRAVAFMDMGRSRLMPMVVQTGRVGDERVEVLSGLEAGDRVATSAQFLLDSESNLMEAMQAMMAQMGQGGMEGRDMEGMEGMEGMDSMPGGDARDSVPAGVRDTSPGGRR